MALRNRNYAKIGREYRLSTAPLALLVNARSAIATIASAGLVLSAGIADAHTDALGYLVSDGSAAGLFDVQVIYGSWHGGNVSAEGAVQLNGADNSVIGTQPFSILLSNAANGTLPAGLTAGQNFFYISPDGNSLVATDTANYGVYNFQAATFTDIAAGTYTFAYASTSGLSQVWTPAGNAISSGTFTVTSDGGVTVPGQANDIDTASPNYGSSNLGTSVNPSFAGGTLLIDEIGQTYPNTFTLDDTATNTIDMNGNTTVLSGAFSDGTTGTPGVITYVDSGTDGQVTLTAQSAYTGTTTLESGTLVLSGSGTLGADVASTVVNGGTLDLGDTQQIQASLTQTGGTVQNGTFSIGTYTLTGGTLAGDATLDVGSTIAAQAGTVDGVLNGSATLTKSGSGTVTLAGGNNYTGGTVVNDGTLALVGAGTLGSSDGATTINGGTLDLGAGSQAQASLTQAAGTVQNGTLTIDTYTLTGGTLAGDTTLDVGSTIDAQAGTVDGGLNGSATLTKSGSGTVTLAGNNSYTGNTIVNDGTLTLAGSGTLGATSGSTTINGGTLDLGGTNQTQTSLTQGPATILNGTLALGTYVISGGTLTSTAAANVSNTIDARAGMIDGVLSGTAALIKTGSGEVTLTAANTFSGGTTIDAGTLFLANTGDIVASVAIGTAGTLDISAANGDRDLDTVTGAGTIALGVNTLTLTQAAGAYAGSISGTGGLILSAGQGYALNGASTYTGGTALLTGSLSLGNSDALGTSTLAMSEFTAINLTQSGMVIGNDITVSGDPTIFVPTGVTATVAGTISDGSEPGDIVKTGGGTLVFTGENTYSAGTAISEGTLQLGDGGTSGSIIGNVANDAVLAFDRSDAVTFAGTISGTGTVVHAGAGTTTLSGVNTYSGGTTISAGALLGSATSFGSGAILDDGSLTLIQTTDATFANAINGNGTFTKQGAGMLTLTGTSGLTGATTVAGGELRIAGSLAASPVLLAGGTRLSGTGSVGGIVAAAGSTIAPGNGSIGTLSVNGNLIQQAGSVYAVQVTAGGSLSDRISATGSATIAAGSTLEVTKTDAPTPYALGRRYTVLTATQGVTGTYTLTGDTAVSAFYDLIVGYDASNVYLDVAQTSSFVSAASTPNERSVAGALDALDPAVGLRNAMGYLQTFEEARSAFGQLSGEIHSSAKSALIQDSQYLRDAVSMRLNSGISGREAERPGVSLWGHGYGSWGSLSGNGNAGQLTRSARGLVAGADLPLGDVARVGVMGGYSRSKFNTAGHRDTGHSDNYHLGIYAGTAFSALSLQIGAAYTWHRLDFDRSVAFTDFADTLSSQYKGNSAQVFGEAGYRIEVNHGRFEPFAQISYVRLHTDGFVENGGDASLVGLANNTEVTISTLGLRGTLDLASEGTTHLSWSTGWRHAFGDRTPFTDLRFNSGSQVFDVSGAPVAQNAAVLQAGIELDMGAGLSIGASYSGQIGRNVQDHGVKGSLTWRF
ncbi:MAG: autotransporter domain-containing protein [Novosphingobium sp.]